MPAVLVVVPPIFRILELPCKVPAVLVQLPVKVCVNPPPRSSVAPGQFSMNPAPPIFPDKVAVPAVFVTETVPVVVKWAIF